MKKFVCFIMAMAIVFGVAGTFAFFQAFMPLTGWICVHTMLQYFQAFEILIPWIALALLGYIGVSMICEGIKNEGGACDGKGIGLWGLFIQGIATSSRIRATNSAFRLTFIFLEP